MEKELKAVERRMAKLEELTEGTHNEMVMHDQSDFTGLAAFMKTLKAYEDETAQLEERWLELSERLG
ncbi:ABC transporter C-terminal domain-containing protein [Demequina sediminis]|uniref:ABC transporter C-terminal domain-containing protein n=1 Tax=Demequina sediminis TaxID=1930058 RepID=UPI0033068964